VVTDNASRRGDAESLHDGKHVGAWDRASARSRHGPCSCLIGTAGYGPVCPVVWAFYYPQVLRILGVGLPLEHLDVCFDELLDDLP
jgi:hypothetical protein